jgi:hypothetical protein
MHGLIRLVTRAAFGIVVAGGCGSEDGNGGTGGAGGYGVDPPSAESYYPQKAGNSWTYLITPMADLPSYKVVTIDAAEMVGGGGSQAGRPAWRHTTCKAAKTVEACAQPPSATNPVDRTVGWLGMVGNVLGNYREQAFKKATLELVEEDWWEPFRTKIDHDPAHTVANARWTHTFKEYKQPTNGIRTAITQTETWQVLGVDETIVVTPPNGPARTYTKCLKVTHNTNSGAVDKVFWYAKGIGKVKEVGTQTEELIDYKVMP